MKIEEIHAWDNSPDTLSKYKADIESEFGIPVIMASSNKGAVEQADILITTTRGKGALVEAERNWGPVDYFSVYVRNPVGPPVLLSNYSPPFYTAAQMPTFC